MQLNSLPEPRPVLDGVRVLELATLLAAPFVGMLLHDYGATVIKVETPDGGDQARTWSPQSEGMGILFARVNMGKKSVAIDLSKPDGQDLIRDLVKGCDVVIENFRPGRLQKWGIGWDQLSEHNERLVMVHVTGYGQTGPYRDRPGFGSIAESEGGFTAVNGNADAPPTIAPFGLGDTVAAMAATYGAMLGLYDVSRTGRGREVDVALYEPILALMGDVMLRYTLAGEVLERGKDNVTAPRGCYLTRDQKWIVIAGSTESVVQRLFIAMGRPDLGTDDRFATNAARIANRADIEKITSEWVSTHDRSDLLALLLEHEVAAGSVNNARDLAVEPAFLARGSIREVHSEMFGGSTIWPGPILRLSDYEGPDYIDAPTIGQHTDEVLGSIGISTARIAAMRSEGVIA